MVIEKKFWLVPSARVPPQERIFINDTLESAGSHLNQALELKDPPPPLASVAGALSPSRLRQLPFISTIEPLAALNGPAENAMLAGAEMIEKAATPSTALPEKKKAVSAGPAASTGDGEHTAEPAAEVATGTQTVHAVSAP